MISIRQKLLKSIDVSLTRRIVSKKRYRQYPCTSHPGENDQMINEGFLAQMKRGSILINTARGELQDNEAILRALKSEHLAGFATDVFANETDVFFRSFKPWEMIPDPAIQQLVELYPRVLITPHVGSNTDEALSNMISTSFENFREIIETGKTKNEVSLPKARQLK